MCFLYPCGIPLLFALLMRRERQRKVGKARRGAFCLRESADRFVLQGEDFLDSYIGFVAAGYSVKARRQGLPLGRVLQPLTACPATKQQSSQAMYWELLEMFRKLAMAAIGERQFYIWCT